ncbi:tyrosine-type recombinase/integrase [Streptomyces sp. NPDC046915]|uniref:tyrosine-type recombinase/integrase n=1 Tax=Streptomyces sp. NPDC046915 TaxID=3155257 RepID=UPI003403EDD4
MLQGDLPERDLTAFVLPEIGRLHGTGEWWTPYQLLGSSGAVVEPVQVFFTELQAEDKPASTIRSYGMDLLRWWRFLWALDIEWNRATRTDARDFSRWMHVANKPQRLHWRHRKAGYTAETAPQTVRKKIAGTPNAITGKPSPGPRYAARTRAHCETVLRTFYDSHLAEGTGPIINPFPLGRYRPTVPKRAPRRIPDEMFNALFAALRHHRDRALLAFWVSHAARAEELLTSRQRDALPGEQLLGVVRKGTHAYQQVPCSADAFVWLRLYQEENRRDGVPQGKALPLWWTLRRPWRPLKYDAARAMFNRANDLLGSNWTLHDLRHTAAYRMARDPKVSLTDVQWVLAHAHLSTTQIYLQAGNDEVIETIRAHHARRSAAAQRPSVPAPGYRPESLRTLFGESR